MLEASAGTGKTYTIAALAARYVAEGVPLERLLLVTFTRMATGELRDRVRERLVSAERELALGVASDDVVRMLADGPPTVVEERRARLVRALADFDAATIATTHGFCQEVLSGLGVAANLEQDATLVEDPGDLLSEVVDDLYVRKYMAGGDALITRGEAMKIAEEVVANPGAPIEPHDRSGDGLPALRARLAVSVRDELDRRKRALAIITYDDLLTRLRDELRQDPGSAARLRERYEVVLVDEFQDTDPIQWEILQRAFGTGSTTLVLIGDPKQAIYAFRGADVYSYLSAAETAGERDTLSVNFRSDQGLIDAYDAMFGGAKLGHEGIVYRHVRAAPEHQASRLSGAPDAAPLRVRVVDRSDPSLETTAPGLRGAELGARAGGARPGGGSRLGALLGRARSTVNRCGRGTWRCWCGRTATRSRFATRWTPSACPRSSTARAPSSPRPRRASGCGCWRRWSGRPRRCARGRRR